MSRAEQASIEAADWLVTQADGPLSPQDQARFEAWFEASEGNKAAYWRLELGWEKAGRGDALNLARDDFEPAAPRRVKPRAWAAMAIAASIVLVVIGVYQFAGDRRAALSAGEQSEFASATYSTTVGERHLVGLPDGSRIQLNTQSALRTRFADGVREVWLDRGEAFFEVAHRANQPFVVHAGDREITVLGTRFSVRREEDKTTVAVLDGRVRLVEMKDNRPMRSSVITAGDIAVASDAATFVAARSESNVAQALSWRDGMLAFDQESLSAISAEFNRYNTRKLVLNGDAVGEIRITGTFPADKPDAFARLLREAYGLQVDENGTQIRIYR